VVGDEMSDYNLLELKIEVNRNCPLKCLHCSSNGQPKASECLNVNRISELVEEFADLGGKKICISGGEPLCYEELLAVIKSCKLANIDVSLYTTGIVQNGGSPKPISDKMVGFLTENGVRIIFSIHGAFAQTHDALTQVRGSFDTTLRAIEKVVDAGATTEIHVVPTAMNFGELSEITRLASSFNIGKISWLRFVPQGRGLLNRHSLQLSKDQLMVLARKKVQLQKVYPAVTIRTGAPLNILCPQVPAQCKAGLSVLTINPDGSISPCDALKQFRLHDDFGNILNHSLVEIWQKSRILNIVRTLEKSKLDSSCASCSLYSKCNSGCIAQKSIASGMLTDGRDPDCLLNDVEVDRDAIEAVTIC
jgi:radical SAM protein with 4Fe4S-binding SPASM domain